MLFVFLESYAIRCFALAEYAQVIRMLGNGRLEAQCVDGIKRLCHIRGKMRKKVWVNTVRNSIILLVSTLHLLMQGIGFRGL